VRRRDLLKGAVATAVAFPVKASPDQPVDDPEARQIPALPETCDEALRRWDAGLSVFTVEMGGIGPGYEQVIHLMVFELIRQLRGVPLKDNEDDLNKQFSDYLKSSFVKELGPSGAQWGAAQNLAYVMLTQGYGDALRSVPDDRHIQVSRQFPHL